MRLKVHPGLCEGHGVCHRFASRVYSLDHDGKVEFQLLEVPPELEVEAEIGASICPANAITVLRDP